MSQDTQLIGNSSDNKITRVVRIRNADVSEELLRQIEIDTPSILKLVFNKGTGNLTVSYDAANVSFGMVQARLIKADINPVDSWWFRIKSACYNFTDQNVASQAHKKSKGCCNRVPGA